jgi:methionyl-tRNA formyltransferase
MIGCVQFSCAMLEQVLTLEDVEVVGVVTRRSSTFNADFCSLEPIAEARDVPVFVDVGNQQEQMARWIRERSPDVVYCFGWPYLLGAGVLEASAFGVVGYHPTELPLNRGRHPIIWALALGLGRTASSFFRMDEGADSGDLLSQEIVEIGPDDDASSLYRRLTEVAARQLGPMTAAIADGSIRPTPQDHGRANHWRKRSRDDGRIDWRMASTTVHDLVRALTRPYPGAHVELDGEAYPVWRSAVVDGEHGDVRNLEPGRILRTDGRTLDVRCGIGVLRLLEHDLPAAVTERTYL